MAIANGKEVKALYFGGERYAKSNKGMTFKANQELTLSPLYGSAAVTTMEPGDTTKILADFGDSINGEQYVVSYNGTLGTVDAKMGGYNNPAIYVLPSRKKVA